MSKKTLALITLAFFLNFIISCTSITTTSRQGTKISLSYEIKAKRYPEVEMKTTSGDIHKGKLIRLKERNLTLLPFPYWDVESKNINLDDIYSIKLIKKRNRAGRGAAGGFAWTFITIGLLGVATCKYDEDYQDALGVSALLGVFGALLGTVIGGISNVASKSEYKFYEMTGTEKLEAIKKIMGYRK